MFLLEFAPYFSKIVLDQTWEAFNTRFGPQWKDQESSYQAEYILTFFSNELL